MRNPIDVINELKSFQTENLTKDEMLIKFESMLLARDKEYNELLKKYDDLSVIVNIIPSTISWINSDLTYSNVNHALAKTCNLSPLDFIGKPIGFHTRENFFLEFATELFNSKQFTLYRELEATIAGEEKVFLVSGTKIHNNQQAVVIGVDITELKNLKGHISLTEKLATLGEMFAGIIHDINNPLMMIDASTKKISRLTSDEEINSILTKIQMSTNRINKIIKGIKIFIRQDEELPYQVENLGKIIEDAIVICENRLKTDNVRLSFDINFNDININCNYTQLFQVFVNLITNSMDAISKLEDKWIEIKIFNQDEKNYFIRFVDSGNGIPLDVAEKMFHAFYTTKGRGVGSGLGLSLVQKILEAHHGQIKLVNNSTNTTFEIVLPKI